MNSAKIMTLIAICGTIIGSPIFANSGKYSPIEQAYRWCESFADRTGGSINIAKKHDVPVEFIVGDISKAYNSYEHYLIINLTVRDVYKKWGLAFRSDIRRYCTKHYGEYLRYPVKQKDIPNSIPVPHHYTNKDGKCFWECDKTENRIYQYHYGKGGY